VFLGEFGGAGCVREQELRLLVVDVHVLDDLVEGVAAALCGP